MKYKLLFLFLILILFSVLSVLFSTGIIQMATTQNVTFCNDSYFLGGHPSSYYMTATTDNWVNETGDTMTGNLTIDGGINAEPTIRFRETGTSQGFDITSKHRATNYLEFKALIDGNLVTRFKIRRRLPEIEVYANMDFQNDWNITNLDCLELDNNMICEWGDINSSASEIWDILDNETFVEKTGDIMTGTLFTPKINTTTINSTIWCNATLCYSIADFLLDTDTYNETQEIWDNVVDNNSFLFITDANNIYLNLSGTNANQNIDIGIYDLTTTGTVTAEQITSTDDIITGDQIIFPSGRYFDSAATAGFNKEIITNINRFRILGTIADGNDKAILHMGDAGSGWGTDVFRIQSGDTWFGFMPEAALVGGFRFFEESALGENRPIRIYGRPTGTQLDYMEFMIAAGTGSLTKAQFNTDSGDGFEFSADVNVIGDLNVTGNLTYKTIYAQLSDLKDQTFPATNTKQPINLTTIDESYGIDILESNITISLSGIYNIAAQPQVATGAGGAGKFHMWLEKYDTTRWLNVSNSNVELVLASNEENVIPLIATLSLNANEKIRIMGSVSDTAIKLDYQAPADEPAIPSIICTIFRLGD